MRRLERLLLGQDDSVTLDVAALELATIEFPSLRAAEFVQILDSYAVELAGRLGDDPDARAFINAANRFLFEELGFQGNREDYYDPRNSCLNEVITRRLGIPITLSVIYLEIGRRLAKPVSGVGLPGHFLVSYADGGGTIFIDPFHGGRLLNAEGCRETALQMAGIDIAIHPGALAPVDKGYIIRRMLNNLRAAYFRRKDYGKTAAVLDLLIRADPLSAEQYKQRGVVRVQLQQYLLARQDLETYLRLAPEAADRAQVERQLASLRRWFARLN